MWRAVFVPLYHTFGRGRTTLHLDLQDKSLLVRQVPGTCRVGEECLKSAWARSSETLERSKCLAPRSERLLDNLLTIQIRSLYVWMVYWDRQDRQKGD